MQINYFENNQNKLQRNCKKGYALTILLIALLVISITVIASIPVLSKKKDTFANTSVYVKDCIANQNAADLNTTACTGAVTGLVKNSPKDYETVMYYVNNSTYTSPALVVVKAACDQGGSKACDILMNRCSIDSTQCDIASSSNDLNYYLSILSSDNSNSGKVYIASNGAGYYLQRMTNFNNAVKAVCNSNMTKMACDIAAETKTRIYNFNNSERADFYESNSSIGTSFHDGVVDLLPGADVTYAYCWGDNYSGQLHPSYYMYDSFDYPIKESSPSGNGSYTQVAITSSSSICGLIPSGAVECWGANDYGQLGNNTTTSNTTHQLVTNTYGGSFTQISAGYNFVCGLTPSGTAYCWGSTPASISNLTPQPVTNTYGGNFSQISGGNNIACGLIPSGVAYCWGNNAWGQLGNNTTTGNSAPQLVTNTYGGSFSQISAGASHTCGLTPSGVAYCWGKNDVGQLGDNTAINKSVPTLVTNTYGGSFSQIIAGNEFSCGVTPSGTAYCWGKNDYGQLGDNTTINKSVPTLVANTYGGSFSQISTGGLHACGLTPSGTAYCWGNNAWGQLGNNTYTSFPTPQLVANTYGGKFTKITSASVNACGIAPVKAVNKAYLTTTNNNNIQNIVGGIKSFSMTTTQPSGTKILGLISIDGRANWKKWNGSSWVTATNNLSTYNFTTTGNANTPAEMQTGLTNLTTGGGTLDFAFYLETDSTGQNTPSIDQVTITYLKER